MAEPGYVSTAEAATALGVAVSTVKRWVDQGVLSAHRTAGGHRRLLRADVLQFAAQANLPPPTLSGAGSPGDLKRLRRSLMPRLERGEADEVGALIRGAHDEGVPPEVFADEVVAPVMAQVGQDWNAGKIDVYQEHRATRILAAGLHEWKQLLSGRGRRGPVALGGGPERDPYELAGLLAELVLLLCGWRVVNLGPNTPLGSFRQALDDLRPQLLWLSVSHLEQPARFLVEYRELYTRAERQRVPVAVGGQALTESVRAAMPYTTFGDGLAHLAAFARTLHPGPRPPKRGRPPREAASGAITDGGAANEPNVQLRASNRA